MDFGVSVKAAAPPALEAGHKSEYVQFKWNLWPTSVHSSSPEAVQKSNSTSLKSGYAIRK